MKINFAEMYTRLCVDAVTELKKPRSIAIAAVLAALNLIINQFTIPISSMLEIGFDFLTVVATAYLCGPWVAGLSGVVTDVLGYILRPNGPYFPGFTLSAILLGVVYGLFYYKRRVTLPRIIACKVVVVALFNFFLTPLWLHVMYGQAFVVLSSMRFIKNVIKFPVDVILLLAVLRACEQYARQSRPSETARPAAAARTKPAAK